MATTSDDFPLYLYEYSAEGRYGKPIEIMGRPGLELLMSSLVKTALAEKREVRITNAGDELVFHAQNGEIVWPRWPPASPTASASTSARHAHQTRSAIRADQSFVRATVARRTRRSHGATCGESRSTCVLSALRNESRSWLKG